MKYEDARSALAAAQQDLNSALLKRDALLLQTLANGIDAVIQEAERASDEGGWLDNQHNAFDDFVNGLQFALERLSQNGFGATLGGHVRGRRVAEVEKLRSAVEASSSAKGTRRR